MNTPTGLQWVEAARKGKQTNERWKILPSESPLKHTRHEPKPSRSLLLEFLANARVFPTPATAVRVIDGLLKKPNGRMAATDSRAIIYSAIGHFGVP